MTNTLLLRSHLANQENHSTGGDSDSELMLRVLAQGISNRNVNSRDPVGVVEALRDVYRLCVGAFACVAMIGSDLLVGYRDSNGIKPLVYGERRCGVEMGYRKEGVDYMICSESAALEKLGYGNIRDVKPGESYLTSDFRGIQ